MLYAFVQADSWYVPSAFLSVSASLPSLLSFWLPCILCFPPLPPFAMLDGFRADCVDYVFLLPGMEVDVTSVMRPARTEELGKGLPRKGIGASDHLAVGCEVAW